MFFNFRLPIALCFLVLLQVGCSLKIGEEPAQNKNIQLGDQVGCLSNIGDVLSQFLNGEIEDRELEAFADCAIFSMQSFEKYTVGEKQSEYHPEEIRHFLQTYFLKDKKISDEFLNQVMNLKVLITGGEKSAITRGELKKFTDLVREWKTEFVSVNRYMKIYNWESSLNLKRTYPPHMVDAAVVALKTFVLNITATFEGGKEATYDWRDLESLLTEFQEFTRWSMVHKNSHPVGDWTFLIQSFRSLSFNNAEAKISNSDVGPFLGEVVSWLSLVLQYHYYIKGHDITSGQGLVNFNKWVLEVSSRLQASLGRHPGHEIEYKIIYQFLRPLENFFDLPLKLTADDINRFFPKLLDAVLRKRGLNSTVVRPLDKFTSDQLQIAFSHYNDWFEIQSYLSAQYPRGSSSDVLANNSETWFNPNYVLYPPGSSSPIKDLRRIIRGIPPLFRKDNEMAFLVEVKKMFSYQVSHDFYNLSHMNLYRTFLSLAMRGYSKAFDEKEVMNSYMTADELQQMYLDVKPIGVRLGLLDPRSDTAGYRSFNEANLFTYVSDGLGSSSVMSFEEGMLLVGYLWSGSILGDNLYQDLIQRCELGPDDINGSEMILRSCVKKYLGPLLKNRILTMPSLKTYLNQLNNSQLDAYADKLVTSAYSVNSIPNWVEKAELNVISMIIHYTESVMTRFNTDGDEFLERDEINASIPLFADFIREIAKSQCINDLDAQLVKDIFRHIVETGEIPRSTSAWSYDGWDLYLQFRDRRGDKWKPQFDRGHITSVFANIISKTLEAKKDPVACED